jgi:energy-coupling factor transport system ATP-binding protein
MATIEVKGLTYTYPAGPAPALRDISFQIETGQLVAVIGANQAGKSTLCLALAGLIPALFHGQMQGTVTVCGMDTRTHTPGQFAGSVGLVLQNPANQLSGMHYTVYEEVAFGLENLGVPRPDMPARIEHRTNSPAGNNNAWRWHPSWLLNQPCCCWMNQPPCSILKAARRSLKLSSD